MSQSVVQNGADLVVANLETPLSRRGHAVPNKYRNLRADPVLIEDVKARGRKRRADRNGPHPS